MAVAQKNRDRLRSALLGPLGQEATDMLMEQVDQSALRDHVDERIDGLERHVDERIDSLERHVDERIGSLERHVNQRFEQQKREMDERFREVDKRFDEVSQGFIQVHAAIKDIGKDTKLMVFSICGAFAVVVVATLFESVRG